MLRLAWRNVWRNRRRSALTIVSVAFGLAGVMMAQSLMKTLQRQMIEKSTGAMSGHLQVQARVVKDRKMPERTLPRPSEIEAALRADPRVEAVSARLLYTGLVYSAAGSRGVLVAGVEPEGERRVSIMPGYVAQGTYFGADPRGVVLGDKLAQDLDVRLGEKVVVMVQSKAGGDAGGGEMNSELFRIAGILHSGSESFDGQIVYIPLQHAQRLRGEEGRVSYLVLRLKEFSQVDAVQAEYAGLAAEADAVALTFNQVGLEIIGIQKFEDAILAVVLVVISIIVGLGILNTVSMSLYERMREFGVLRAIGARPGVLLGILALEGVLLGALGIGLGAALGLGIIAYFGAFGLYLPVGKALAYFVPFETVIYLRPAWSQHLWSAVELGAVALLAGAGPAFRASRLRVAEALRHV